MAQEKYYQDRSRAKCMERAIKNQRLNDLYSKYPREDNSIFSKGVPISCIAKKAKKVRRFD
jgi:hypothetical protein